MAVTLKGNNGTYEGTSEDNKPLDVPVNTEFNELDTGKTYYFDGETWNEEPPCEGSGFTPTTEQLTAMNSGIDSTKVAQIETNENNISSLNTEIDAVANLGAKNLLDFETWASNITVYNGTKSYSNGVMTVTATGSSCVTYHNQYFPEALKISVKEGEKYIVTWDTTVTTNIGFFQLCPNGNAISGTDVSIANKQVEYTVGSGITYLTYRVGVWASGNSINISKLMLRPASISDSTYQPYAMSNVGLTNGILNWSKSENRLLSSQVDVNTMFDVDNSSVYVYTNEILKRVVIATSLKVKTAISSPYSTIALADLPHTHYPIVSINALTSNFKLTKNDANNVIAFTASADVEVGTVLKQQLEYTYY